MAAPADQKVNATYFTCTPVPGCDQMEANFHLYIHQFGGGPNINQRTIVNPPNPPQAFGQTVVNDWEVREGSDPASKLIAHAEGIHVQSAQTIGRWYSSFDIVFEDDSFKGSTLSVRGFLDPAVPINWAVVGGTGQFTLAQGIITGTYKNDGIPNHGLMEVSIRIFYRTIN